MQKPSVRAFDQYRKYIKKGVATFDKADQS